MNLDFLKCNHHTQTEKYLDMLHSNNISPIITKPTRITNYIATLIDHIYTNNTNQMISGIATIDILDHLPTFCIVDIPVKKQKFERYYRDYRQFDSELYLQDIKAIDWNSIYIESNDLNEIATKSISTLQLIVHKHAPRKQIFQSKQKQFSKPWITNDILKSIKTKQSIYRTHFLSNNPPKKAEYKKYANKLNHLKTVNHDILLSKLYIYGICGTSFKWFKSYLCNCTQFVKIDEIESSMETITCGVPQGSTLRPLLFLLYINDLPNSSEKLSFRIFANDTNIFFTSSNPNEVEFTMNEKIKSVLKYCAINKLSVNFKKTNYMLITSSKKKNTFKYPQY